jgi:phosphoribosylformylglycinamidine synthase
MKTSIFLISKTTFSGQVYWIHSKHELDLNVVKKIGNDPDIIFLINPTVEWKDLDFTEASIISFLPGVTDNAAVVFREFLELGKSDNEIYNVHSGNICWGDDHLYFNELIQKKLHITKSNLILNTLDLFPINVEINHQAKTNVIEITNGDPRKLLDLSIEMKWALSQIEMMAIKEYYELKDTKTKRIQRGLTENPTDIEMEVFAQTWSEHCKHKIFNAEIEYSDDRSNFKIDSIYKTYIKGATFKLNRPWAVSVFNDNAGIVDWDESNYLAIKVETHNSPSALDPYGGALTGILGVNRDILGTGLGFSPIGNTNVFCVGEWDEQTNLPDKLIHPKSILKGIHKGVQDGGNKSGIPTINGAICFDENFTGKPLVYCGTIGIAPKNILGLDIKNKYHEANDLIIMAGGLVGLDGIHGATMSSVALDSSVPKTMVQIGDPFTQKKLTDFILNCRNLGLIKGITDNGAGGLSSSIGEMAEKTNGARVFLDKVPLKYSGLNPWEIFVSESQERMSFAISANNLEEILKLGKKHNVIVTHIGEFTSTGNLELIYKNELVGLIDLNFLHNGLPKLKLKAKWDGSKNHKPTFKTETIKKESLIDKKLDEILIKIIGDKNIVSKNAFIKQYDHEVKAATIIKPMEGRSEHYSPNDSGTIWLYPHGGEISKAVTIASGIQYHFSHIDTELMAKLSFDEAMRGVVASGANPEKVAMTDNFCWPDPIATIKNSDGEHKLAQLVRAARGLFDISVAYEVPMISGKDSMKNDFQNENIKISVPPTLLMTAMGFIEDTKNLKKSMFKDENLLVYKIGLNFSQKYFGHFLNKYYEINSENDFEWDLLNSIQLYRTVYQNLNLLQTIHDVSEGGVIVSIVESLFANKLGLKFDKKMSIEELFSEYPSQFIVSVNKVDKEQFENNFKNYFTYLGLTNNNFEIEINEHTFSLNTIEKTWRTEWK